MEPIVLHDAASGSTARVAAHLGFNCYEFQAGVDGRTIDVLDSHPDFISGNERASGNGIPVLFPFPNRIRGGRFRWEGKDYEIPESGAANDGQGNAIHGFCLDRPWRVTGAGDHYVVGQFQLSKDAPERAAYWPSDCLIEMRYELRGSTLRADVLIANPSDVAMPWGFGTHPYFRLPLSSESQSSNCLVQAPATEQWELIDCLPTGKRLPLPEEKDLREGAYFDRLKLDDVLTGLPEGEKGTECVIMDEKAGFQVSQSADPEFRELVVFTPPGRDAICFEPYTCVTDAINLERDGVDAGWRVLGPGEEYRTWIEIRAGLVIA